MKTNHPYLLVFFIVMAFIWRTFAHPWTHEQVSSVCDEIYYKVLLLEDAEPAISAMKSFIESCGLSKAELSEVFCEIVLTKDFSCYEENEQFRSFLILQIGNLGETNALETLRTIVENEPNPYKEDAAADYLRVSRMSQEAFDFVEQYMDDPSFAFMVYTILIKSFHHENLTQEARDRMIQFVQKRALIETNDVEGIDIFLSNYCPTFPNSSSRKNLYDRVGKPVPKTPGNMSVTPIVVQAVHEKEADIDGCTKDVTNQNEGSNLDTSRKVHNMPSKTTTIASLGISIALVLILWFLRKRFV